MPKKSTLNKPPKWIMYWIMYLWKKGSTYDEYSLRTSWSNQGDI
jgi:hypothetical protein